MRLFQVLQNLVLQNRGAPGWGDGLTNRSVDVDGKQEVLSRELTPRRA